MLGIILLVVLIVLGVKLIYTINSFNRIMDDVEKKVHSLDSFFHLIDTITDRMALLSDRVIEITSGLISKLFRRNKNEKEAYYE